MLKHRVFTAVLLAVPLVWIILKLSVVWTAVIIGVFTVLASWEWARLAGLHTNAQRLIYSSLIAAGLFAIYFFLPLHLFIFAAIACLGWVWAAFHVVSYRGGTTLPRHIKAVIGVILLVPSWAALFFLHKTYGPYSLLFLFCLIWTADIAAYFSGRQWGQRKLAPQISPGKTWAGAVGACVAGVALAALAAWWKTESLPAAIFFVVLCYITIWASILGDLFESLFKRQAGVKDSGVLLPGHGGVLDRIDSITAAAPVFVTGLWLMEKSV